MEDAFAEPRIHDVAGVEQVHQCPGVGQAEVALLGQLAAFAHVVSQGCELLEDRGHRRRGPHCGLAGQEDGWQLRPGRSHARGGLGQEALALVLGAGVEVGHPGLQAVVVAKVHAVGRGRPEEGLGHAELRGVAHGLHVIGREGLDGTEHRDQRACRCVPQAFGVEELEEGAEGDREAVTFGLGHAQLAGTPVQEELGDVPGGPGGQVAVAVATLPVQGHAGVGRHLVFRDGTGTTLGPQPLLEAVQQALLGLLEAVVVVVVRIEAQPHQRSLPRRSTTVGDPGRAM